MTLMIQGGEVVTATDRYVADVFVDGETITAIGEDLAMKADRTIDAKGLFVMPGVGRLVRVDRKARTGRNPATGEAIKIPAKKVVKFRIAKAVKDSIVPPKAKK